MIDNFVSNLIYNEVDTWNRYIMTEVVTSIFAIMGESEIKTLIEELNTFLDSYSREYKLCIVPKLNDVSKESSNG